MATTVAVAASGFGSSGSNDAHIYSFFLLYYRDLSFSDFHAISETVCECDFHAIPGTVCVRAGVDVAVDDCVSVRTVQ